MAKTNKALKEKMESAPSTKRELSPAQSVKHLLDRMAPEMQKALPKHISIERLCRIALTEVRKNPKLLKANQSSLAGAIMTCAQLGLEPGPLQQIHLVPFYNKKTGTHDITPIIGFQGLADLAMRGGKVLSVRARVVYDGDAFSYDEGLHPKLEHEPSHSAERSDDDITHAYAIAEMERGNPRFEVMFRKEIEAIRKRSRAGTSGPWVTDYAEMCKKTVLRRLLKTLPKSVEFAEAVEAEDRIEFGDADVDIDLGEATVEEENNGQLEAGEESSTRTEEGDIVQHTEGQGKERSEASA